MIGIDVVENHRIARMLRDYGQRFANRILSDWEKHRFNGFASWRRRVEFLAGRFAAKEAVVKVLGAMGKQAPAFNKMTIRDGQVRVEIDEENAVLLTVSISHEKSVTVAVALYRDARNHKEDK